MASKSEIILNCGAGSIIFINTKIMICFAE
jgi:hypothetical protein